MCSHKYTRAISKEDTAKMDNRFTIEILEDIASLPRDDQVIDALRHAPRFVRELLVFAYGDHEIALPTGRMSTTPITFRAFVEGRDERMAVESSCGDLLATEAGKLRKLYVRGGHPTLKSCGAIPSSA
jgi:hypothetical protein